VIGLEGEASLVRRFDRLFEFRQPHSYAGTAPELLPLPS
jgi:hypothetical protein